LVLNADRLQTAKRRISVKFCVVFFIIILKLGVIENRFVRVKNENYKH
jgi:hypothetical protein